jgi:membrane-associated protease RseP (regulator of RpoE activity)
MNKSASFLLHIGLFLFTFFTTTVAGVQWLNLDPYDLTNFSAGIPFSASILFILSCHEFGHYFAARFHGVDATLPYYIPFPNLPGFINFGTLGAVIKTKTSVPSTRVMFDIGVAGPIAGFFATAIVLIYGFTHLPGIEFILRIHPDYFQHQSAGIPLTFGNSLLYGFFSFVFTDPANQFVPPMSEMYHYPYLLAGWFGLFVTAMNLLPVGQLDGGHLTYSMFGRHHRIISRIAFGFIIAIGLTGLLPIFGYNIIIGWSGWLFWGLILYFAVRLDHPSVVAEEPLEINRRLIGWFTYAIFVLTFTPSPFSVLL